MDGEFDADGKSQELFLVQPDPIRIQEDLLVVTTEQISSEMNEDRELILVRKHLNNSGKWPDEIMKYHPFQKEMYAIGSILMKGAKMVLPKGLREKAKETAHIGHPGMTNMKNLLRLGVWWPGMDREIEKYVESCPDCQLVTKTSHPLPIEMTNIPNNPWDFVSMDFATISMKDKALVLVDNYSKFLVIVYMEKTDTESVKRALTRVFFTYNLPKTLKADNGPPFGSDELKDWLKEKWGVTLINTTPLNPTENGLVERSMQGINKVASIVKTAGGNLRNALAEYAASYNSWPHAITKVPPAQLMFGRVVRTLLPRYETEKKQLMDDSFRDLVQEAKFKRNDRENAKRGAKESELLVGDRVLVRQEKVHKTDPNYKNVFNKIIEMDGRGRVTLQEEESKKIFKRNVKQLKKFKTRDEEEPYHRIDPNGENL